MVASVKGHWPDRLAADKRWQNNLPFLAPESYTKFSQAACIPTRLYHRSNGLQHKKRIKLHPQHDLNSTLTQ